jgi:hypothetical protein
MPVAFLISVFLTAPCPVLFLTLLLTNPGLTCKYFPKKFLGWSGQGFRRMTFVKVSSFSVPQGRVTGLISIRPRVLVALSSFWNLKAEKISYYFLLDFWDYKETKYIFFSRTDWPFDLFVRWIKYWCFMSVYLLNCKKIAKLLNKEW